MGACEIAEETRASVVGIPYPTTQAGAFGVAATSREEGTRAFVAASLSPNTQARTSEIAETSQEEGAITSVAGSPSPTTQEVLNLAAYKYLNTIDPPKPIRQYKDQLGKNKVVGKFKKY